MKKPTAADRPEFRRDLAEMVQKLDIKAGEVNQDAMVVFVRYCQTSFGGVYASPTPR